MTVYILTVSQSDKHAKDGSTLSEKLPAWNVAQNPIKPHHTATV